VPKTGDVAPPFETKDHTGKDVKLADLKGKRVVLWFYPKADTPGCTMEGCGFRDLHAEFQKKGALVYGISYDKPEDNAAFAKKFNFPYLLLSDTDCAIAKAYGAHDPNQAGYPKRNTYVIGPDGKLEHVIEGVKPKFHAQELLAKLPG